VEDQWRIEWRIKWPTHPTKTLILTGFFLAEWRKWSFYPIKTPYHVCVRARVRANCWKHPPHPPLLQYWCGFSAKKPSTQSSTHPPLPPLILHFVLPSAPSPAPSWPARTRKTAPDAFWHPGPLARLVCGVGLRGTLWAWIHQDETFPELSASGALHTPEPMGLQFRGESLGAHWGLTCCNCPPHVGCVHLLVR
jgi:hypothetical protein